MSGASGRINSDYFHLGRLRTLDEINDRIVNLKLEQVNGFLEQHPFGPFDLVTLGEQALEIRDAISNGNNWINGLTILAECNPQSHFAAYGFFVRTGARDESPQINGVSHFLEHMVFKGSERTLGRRSEHLVG